MVTVLTTLYNKAPFVEEAIASVQRQSYTNWELLVVDDGSTDDGLARVKAIDDARIRVLESPVNTGRAAAANRGLEAARGAYIAVLDADDRMLPERLARQVAFMEAHPQVGISGTAYRVMGPGGVVGRWPADDDACRAQLLFGDPVAYQTSIMRRKVIEAHGLRCDAQWLHPGMDYLFVSSFMPHTRYANLPNVLLEYRMGDNNMRHGREPHADKRRLTAAIFNRVGLPLTDEELDRHMLLRGFSPLTPTREALAPVKAWAEKLAAMNRESKLFPEEPFQANLNRLWSRLFYPAADDGWRAGWAHLRLSGHYPADRLSYLIKAAFNRLATRER